MDSIVKMHFGGHHVRPLVYLSIIPTSVNSVQVWAGVVRVFVPTPDVGCSIGTTHERLTETIDTVIDMVK